MSFVHELGHALGYRDHSPTATDVMHKGDKRLLEDEETTGVLLEYFVERFWTEINMLKNNDDGIRIFVIDIIV